MSGIVGIVNLDGAPVDAGLLDYMTQFLTFCGPDRQQVWREGAVGFGHTLLRTTFEAEQEEQPCSLDGQVWIVADARVDGRAELLGKLQAKGRSITKDRPDVELILHAYHVWGERCLEHLIGDFAFAIWDERQRRLFCARDHWGVKPFFYAKVGNCLVFSNALNCVRIHPAVSDELNDLFIGDFLLFGASQEFDNSAFADIQRLPPAHYAICAEGAWRLQRYWELPTEIPIIRYKRPEEYIEHFCELLHTVVADRLRIDRAAVSMSGGLDSTAIAAIVTKVGLKQTKPIELQAFTIVYDHLIPDNERYYASLAADALKIPIHYFAADNYVPYAQWDQKRLQQPEPFHFPQLAMTLDFSRKIVGHSRVVLTGWDGDAIFVETPGPYLNNLFRNLGWKDAILGIWRYLLSQKRFPPLGFRTWLQRIRQQSWYLYKYPTWINETFTQRLALQIRWEDVGSRTVPKHPTRPKAYKLISSLLWPQYFESCDPGTTQLQLEARHPLTDLRMVDYALSIPPAPWIVDKELMRQAMFGILPEAVRRRPKTPLAGDPSQAILRRQTERSIKHYISIPQLATYVDVNRIPQVSHEENIDELWMNLRPLTLNYWLRSLSPINSHFKSEEKYEHQIESKQFSAGRDTKKAILCS